MTACGMQPTMISPLSVFFTTTCISMSASSGISSAMHRASLKHADSPACKRTLTSGHHPYGKSARRNRTDDAWVRARGTAITAPTSMGPSSTQFGSHARTSPEASAALKFPPLSCTITGKHMPLRISKLDRITKSLAPLSSTVTSHRTTCALADPEASKSSVSFRTRVRIHLNRINYELMELSSTLEKATVRDVQQQR